MARRATVSDTHEPADASATSETKSSSETPSVVAQAQEATEQVQETVSRLGDSLRDQMVSRLGEQKEKIAGGLETMSLALQTAGSEVRQNGSPTVAQYIEGAGGRLETLSGTLRENEVDALTAKVEQVARQRPNLFLATTLGVGLLASRLFKTSSRNQAEREQEKERREEGRQKRLREEEERQWAAATDSAKQKSSPSGGVGAVSRNAAVGGIGADDVEAAYASDALPPFNDLVDPLTTVPPAPGFDADAIAQVDEDALTAALLDPTGLGADSVDVAYDAEVDPFEAAKPGRERS